MGITGRYNFEGIQKAARLAIDAALAATTWGAWLAKSAFKPAIDALEDLAINWLANRGLIVLNIGEIYIDGVLDQYALDTALDEGLRRIKQGRDTISAAEGQAIDDKVREAFDRDVDLPVATVVRDVQHPSVRAGDNTPL